MTPICADCTQADVILGPTSWRLVLDDAKYIDLVVKNARARVPKPPSKEKKGAPLSAPADPGT